MLDRRAATSPSDERRTINNSARLRHAPWAMPSCAAPQVIGPNLAAMQSRGAEAILLNVIDPNREVNPQYVEYVVQTTNGRTTSGLLASETAGGITLKRAGGETETVRRADIRRMRSSGLSIMPEGLEQEIDHQGMADLIAYVMTAK